VFFFIYIRCFFKKSFFFRKYFSNFFKYDFISLLENDMSKTLRFQALQLAFQLPAGIVPALNETEFDKIYVFSCIFLFFLKRILHESFL